MKTIKLTAYLSDYFDVNNIEDSSLNGVQVESTHKETTKITFAVDFSLEAVKFAKKNNSQMLFVHHGLIWKGLPSITGLTYEYIAALIKNSIALYGMHLPLDMHPEVGHNIELCRILNLGEISPFGNYKGTTIGFSGKLKKAVSLKTIAKELEKKLKTKNTLLEFGPKTIKSIAVVSGGAADLSLESKEKNIDLYITGETSHSWYNKIKDSRINVLFGGHYATETLGLKKTAEHLKEKFGLKTAWFDNPTGL